MYTIKKGDEINENINTHNESNSSRLKDTESDDKIKSQIHASKNININYFIILFV